jgi:hypothetical protein
MSLPSTCAGTICTLKVADEGVARKPNRSSADDNLTTPTVYSPGSRAQAVKAARSVKQVHHPLARLFSTGMTFSCLSRLTNAAIGHFRPMYRTAEERPSPITLTYNRACLCVLLALSLQPRAVKKK